MAEDRIVLLCSCEDTMPLANGTVRKACRGAEVKTARQLCRAELDRFRDAAACNLSIVAPTSAARFTGTRRNSISPAERRSMLRKRSTSFPNRCDSS